MGLPLLHPSVLLAMAAALPKCSLSPSPNSFRSLPLVHNIRLLPLFLTCLRCFFFLFFTTHFRYLFRVTSFFRFRFLTTWTFPSVRVLLRLTDDYEGVSSPNERTNEAFQSSDFGHPSFIGDRMISRGFDDVPTKHCRPAPSRRNQMIMNRCQETPSCLFRS